MRCSEGWKQAGRFFLVPAGAGPAAFPLGYHEEAARFAPSRGGMLRMLSPWTGFRSPILLKTTLLTLASRPMQEAS